MGVWVEAMIDGWMEGWQSGRVLTGSSDTQVTVECGSWKPASSRRDGGRMGWQA